MAKLTAKQQAFVNEYLIDLNATQAAIRAGYSENTAQQTGSENLSKPVIAEAIKEGMEKRATATEITAERVLKAIADIGFSTSEDIKPNERLRGLELLGKHLVLFSEKTVHTTDFKGDLREIPDAELARIITSRGSKATATTKGSERKPH